MNMPATKTGASAAIPVATAKILPLASRRPSRVSRFLGRGGDVAARIIPPIVVIAIAVVVWELLCRRTGATLPPPSRVLNDTWELIADPFFDRGGIDRGDSTRRSHARA
jgi:nitrate/nitrite transport system permease protein